MRVSDAMTRSPASCEPNTPLRLVAQLMLDHECAAIPVTESGKLVGSSRTATSPAARWHCVMMPRRYRQLGACRDL